MDKKTITYLKAEKRVKEMKSFYRFLFVYVTICCFLMAINFVSDRHEFWSIYPVLGLSLALAFKYARVFGWPGFGKDWEERKFYEEIENKRAGRTYTIYVEQGKTNSPSSSIDAPRIEPDLDKLELKELRKQWNDSEFV